MKKWTLLLLIAVFGSVFSQEEKYEIAVVGFYNLENLFDTDSSMQVINVDKLQNGDVDFVQDTTFSTKEYYSSDWKSQFFNLRISKSKTDFNELPEVPVTALQYSKAKRKEFNRIYRKNLTKAEWKDEIISNDKVFTKAEYKELLKNNTTIEVNAKTSYQKINDTENTPKGARQYTQQLYEDKLDKLAEVISQLGTNYSEDGIALLGLAEIENEKVIRDLIKSDKLKNSGFDVEHYDCLYSRGVDVGLIYQPKYFEVIESNTLSVELYNDKKETSRYYTRDILWVKGKLLGETVHVFVNHWPSRYGGEMKSSPGREKAAAVCKTVIDSLMAIDKNTQIILMGDLNDDPTNKSVMEVLGASAKNAEDVKDGDLFNPLLKDYKKGYGSLGYRGSWNLFDQVILSSSFVTETAETWKMHDAEIVYNQDWINRFGGYEGGSNRSFGGNHYQGGYSDHLPSVVYLKRIAKEDKDKDGIIDEEDACPETFGLAEFDGCPDTDEDGITDAEDNCPDVKGLANFNGCPDTDGDGVEDKNDACPEESGPKENKGCPYPDTDGDGVLDKDDNCPETKGLKENNGCPEVKEEVKKAVKAVFENLVFETGKSTIKASSNDELTELAIILKENPELLLTISGHTDNVGNAENNMTLSKERAEAAKARLIEYGVSANRIQVFYYGETQPIATNDTAAGRQKNRRVDFEVKAK